MSLSAFQLFSFFFSQRLITSPPRASIVNMSTTEIKKTAENLTPEERVYLAAYLKHLARVDDPSYQAELARLNDEIDTGKKFSLEQVTRLHDALKAEGL